MIIECSYCESTVDAKIIGEHLSDDPQKGPPSKTILAECPICNNSLLGSSEHLQTDIDTYIWTDLTRLWPKKRNSIHLTIPAIAQNSLIEAETCFRAKAYDACAVMSGRSLEGICLFYKTKNKNLAQGLKELRDKGIIDDRLFNWSEELRKLRNIAAHATDKKISKEDAKDLLDFANAICEYIFVLTEKFNKFMARKSKTAKSKNS
jgi:hypothetical protein